MLLIIWWQLLFTMCTTKYIYGVSGGCVQMYHLIVIKLQINILRFYILSLYIYIFESTVERFIYLIRYNNKPLDFNILILLFLNRLSLLTEVPGPIVVRNSINILSKFSSKKWIIFSRVSSSPLIKRKIKFFL